VVEEGTRTNPYTGEWSPTQYWTRQNSGQPYHPVNNPLIETTYVPDFRGAWLREETNYDYAEDIHYQIDLFGGFEFGRFRGASLGAFYAAIGASYGSSHNENKWVGLADGDEDINGDPYYDYNNRWSYNPPRPQRNSEDRTVNWHTASPKRRKSQYYINSQLDFFQKRLQFTAGLTHREQRNQQDINYTTGNFPWGRTSSSKKTVPTYAVLYKVTPQTSVYASHSKNSDPGRHWDGTQDVDHWSDGRMYEVGAKQEFFNRRLFITAAYFDIEKQNLYSAHPDNWQFPRGALIVLPTSARMSRLRASSSISQARLPLASVRSLAIRT